MRFPVNQVSLTNNSEGERESKAEDESKLTEKEGLGSSPLFASFTVSTYIVVSLFAVPRSGHTEHTGFPFVPTYAELKCEKLIVLRSVKAYTNSYFGSCMFDLQSQRESPCMGTVSERRQRCSSWKSPADMQRGSLKKRHGRKQK